MGVVYRARQLSLGRLVALKVMDSRGVSLSERARFSREARAASSIHHPNLVEVYGYWEDAEKGLFYYAMRLVEGPSLREVLHEFAGKGGPPSRETTRLLVERIREIASALHALHEAELIHRDVKPGNIVLEGSSGPGSVDHSSVLVDLGLVRPLEKGLTKSSIHLSVPYSSPEQRLGRPPHPSHDVYSLGVCLHDLLSARRPEERLEAAPEGPERLSQTVPGVDPDLDAVVGKAVEREARWRYPSAGELEADLSAWLARRPVTARPPHRLEAAKRWAYRHPERVLAWAGRAIGASLLVLLVGLGISRTSEIFREHRAARDAWEDADLGRLAGTAERLPGYLDALLFPREVASILREVRRIQGGERPSGGQTPVEQVMAILLQEGAEEAWLHSARFLERDGIAKHAVLSRFLLLSLDGRDSPELLRIVGRLFNERPDDCPESTKSSGSLRGALVGLLDRREGSGALLALTALAGCGTAAEVEPVIVWIERQPEPRDPEPVRLGLRCLEAILRRSGLCGYTEEARQLATPGLLERVAAVVGSVQNHPMAESVGLAEAEAGVFVQVALFRREAGLPPCSVEPSKKYSDRVAAVRRSEALWTATSAASFPWSSVEELGELVAYWGEERFEQRARRVCLELAMDRGVESQEIIYPFEERLAQARPQVAGMRNDWAPPPEAHMGHFLGKGEPGMQKVTAEPVRIVSEETLASWDFTGPGIMTSPSESETTGHLVVFNQGGQKETSTDDDGYVQLGVPGASTLSLVFPTPRGYGRGCSVRVFALKHNAVLLPYRGVAHIDILLDGEILEGRVRFSAGGLHSTAAPVGASDLLAKPQHTLTIRLAEASTTPLRVHRVQVVKEPGR